MRMSKSNKKQFLELIENDPNILRACKRMSIARSTLYRWMDNDTTFRDAVRDSQEIGQDTMNDFVESKLIQSIRDGSSRSIEFYLRHNNPKYASTRVESEHFDKRSVGRMAYMPSGVDGMYYSAEININDTLAERMRIRQELNKAKIAGGIYDPEKPIAIEMLGKIFAEEFYMAFPDAKEKISEQMQEYYMKKRQQEPKND